MNRNYFGRQVDSFHVWLNAPALGADPAEAVFIRAPAVFSTGADVETLASLPGEAQVVVAVRQQAILATAFHPELTQDTRWHTLFVDIVRETVCEPAQTVPRGV